MSNHNAVNGGPQTNGINGHAGSNVDIEAIVIGAGFSGLRMLYELRERGVAGKLFESGSGVGGVCISLLSIRLEVLI